MMVKLSHLYAEQVWDRMPLPRKFFIKHRGFGPSHGRDDLLLPAPLLRARSPPPSARPNSPVQRRVRHLTRVRAQSAHHGGRRREGDRVAAPRACAACRTAVRLGDAGAPPRDISRLSCSTRRRRPGRGRGRRRPRGYPRGYLRGRRGRVDPEYGRRRGALCAAWRRSPRTRWPSGEGVGITRRRGRGNSSGATATPPIGSGRRSKHHRGRRA